MSLVGENWKQRSSQFIFTCSNAVSVSCPMRFLYSVLILRTCENTLSLSALLCGSVSCPMRFLYSVLILRTCENTLSLSALLCGRQRSTLNKFFIRGNLGTLFFCFFLFYLPFLSSIHEKANCIAILWTGSPHSLGSCLFRGL